MTLSLWVGRLVASGGDIVETLIILGVGAITINLILRPHHHWPLLCVGMASIAVGHRGVYIGRWTYFVPLQVIVWGLWGIQVLNRVIRGEKFDIPAPLSLSLLTLWAVGRGLLGWAIGEPWDSVLSWTSPLIFGFPAFWIVNRLIKSPEQVELSIKILLGVGALMSLLGLVEYYFPVVTGYIPWFFKAGTFVTRERFARARFGFWGYPHAASIIAWAVAVAYFYLLKAKKMRDAWGPLLVFGVSIWAVYISGTRTAWIEVALSLIVINVFGEGRGVAGLMVLGTVIAFGILFSPEGMSTSAFWTRLMTIGDLPQYAIAGEIEAAPRLTRWSWAIKNFLDHPILGIGYGHQLVHNAFLGIASKIGLFPVLFFIVYVIQLFRRVWKVKQFGRTKKARGYGVLFLALVASWFVQLQLQTVLQVPPYAVAIWIYMAVAWYLIDIYDDELVADFS